MDKTDIQDVKERDIVIGLIVSTDFIKKIKPVWRPDLIENPECRRVAGWYLDYFEKHGHAPETRMEVEAIYMAHLESVPKSEMELVGRILERAAEAHQHNEIRSDALYDRAVEYFRMRHAAVHVKQLEGLTLRGRIQEAEELAQAFRPFDVGSSIGLVVLRGNEIEEKQVEWLWPNRIAYGVLTLIAGEGGIGKSLLTCDLAARVTRGWSWPEPGQPKKRVRDPTDALIISAEDAADSVIVPRLRLAEANQRRIHIMQGERDAQGDILPWTFANVAHLDQWLAEHPNVKLVIIDPTGSFIPDSVDSKSDTKVRGVLRSFMRVAEKRNIAGILVHHFNKGGKTGQDRVQDRLMDSVAYRNVARGVHAVIPDGTSKDQFLFVHDKNNLGPIMPGIRCRRKDQDNIGYVEWLDSVEITADEALSKGGRKTKVELAAEWLREQLIDGPKPAKQMFELGKEAGHSADALRAARESIGARSNKEHHADGGWVWSMADEGTARTNNVVSIQRRKPDGFGLAEEDSDAADV